MDSYSDTMRIATSLTDLVGHTPLLHLTRLAPPGPARVLAKLEFFNPAGSVKDRTALALIEAARADGRLPERGTIIEASSGNTAIALAWIGARLGHRVVIAMPDDVSLERRALLRALGAQVVLTPGAEGMAGANGRAEEILAATPGAFLAGQGGNPANPAVHEATTGPEIWDDTDGQVDALVATTGTGGTISGAGAYLKRRNPRVHVVGVEPAEAPVLSGGKWSPHKIQGITGGDGVPPVTDLTVIDEIVTVPGDTAIDVARQAMTTEGLLVGISAGAALAAAIDLAGRTEFAGRTIVAVLPDTGERYLSTELFAHARA